MQVKGGDMNIALVLFHVFIVDNNCRGSITLFLLGTFNSRSSLLPNIQTAIEFQGRTGM